MGIANGDDSERRTNTRGMGKVWRVIAGFSSRRHVTQRTLYDVRNIYFLDDTTRTIKECFVVFSMRSDFSFKGRLAPSSEQVRLVTRRETPVAHEKSRSAEPFFS